MFHGFVGKWRTRFFDNEFFVLFGDPWKIYDFFKEVYPKIHPHKSPTHPKNSNNLKSMFFPPTNPSTSTTLQQISEKAFQMETKKKLHKLLTSFQ
jgi:hypothetical protein